MTRSLKALSIAVVLVLSSSMLLAAEKSADKRTWMPTEGSMGVTGSIGLASGIGGDFDEFVPAMTGSFEYYTTSRVSWRGLLGLASFEADEPSDAEIDYVFTTANVVYNWEGGYVHPFVTGGVGMYFKDASGGLSSESGDNEFGINGGAGVDWFIQGKFALHFEGSLHGLTGADPDSFFVGTAGVKWWF